MRFWLLAAALLLQGRDVAAFGRTFGIGYTPDMGEFCAGNPLDTVLLNYTVSPGAKNAVLHHFWSTGPQIIIDRIWVSVYVDGESKPSVAFQPSMVCGVAYPELLPSDRLFSAGSVCGRGAAVGGFYHTIPIPFTKSVVVTVRPSGLSQDGKCVWGYLNVRGTEDLPVALPHSGLVLPPSARLQLYRTDWTLRQPLERVNITNVDRGTQGIVFMTSFAVGAQPVGGSAVGGGYIEGCWQFYSSWDTPFPGLVVGTGVEDYFDSSYYFGADSFVKHGQVTASALTGLPVFNRTADGLERISAYRVHATDPLSFTNGGRLVWTVGAAPQPGRTKCGMPLPKGAPLPQLGQRQLSPVNVTSYAWVYSWPADPNNLNV